MVAFLGTVLILALLTAFLFHEAGSLPLRFLDAGGQRLDALAGKVRDAFVAVTGMQPRVKVNEQVVFEQASPVLELAVLNRETTVERETENTWLGSTKRLRVRGVFRVKAGFDLQQPITASVDDGHADTIRVQMPPPKLLSVELEKIEVLTMDNGLWNHVQPEEFEQEVNLLNLEAHRKAWNEGVAGEAQKLLGEQLQEKLGPARRVEIITPTTVPPPGKP